MLSETRAELAALLEALPHGALIIGLDGVVRAANHAAAGWLDVRPDDLAGAGLSEVTERVVPGLHPVFEQIKAGTSGPRDVTITHRGREIRVRMAAVRGPDRRPTGVLVTFEDNSTEAALRKRCEVLVDDLEQARAETDLRLAHARDAIAASQEELQTTNEELQVMNEELRERLQQLDEAERISERKNEFLAMLAHELRNPLAPLVSALYIIRQRMASEPLVRKAVQIADRQVRHQTRLLDDLLDVSRLDAGKIALEHEPVNLTAIVQQVMEAIDLSIRSNAHRLTVDLPRVPLFVDGDPTRLEQVVWNLLSNAVKYTPAGGHIGLSLAEQDGRAVLTVRDSGVGIAPEVLPRVFELFVQGHASLARSQGGLGIGLTLVRRLVELHGGTVVARSEGPGRGSEFEVRLPLGRPRDSADLSPMDRPVRRALRIAVIEDNRDARDMLRTVLELQGHQVHDAADGVAGVQLVITTVPDVVLLDIGLPGIDGYEVARRLRRRLGDQVRLVALTGYGDPDTRHATAAAGFDDHLVKPVEPEELARVLTTSGAERAARARPSSS